MRPKARRWTLQPAIYGVKAAASLDPATTAWVAAVVSAGGAVSAAQQSRVNNFVVAAKGHGYWSKIDVMFFYASENTKQANIDISHLVAATAHGTPVFTASQGYANSTNSGADWQDTGWAPSTGPNFAQFSGTLGYYVRNNRTTSDGSENGLNDPTLGPNSLQSNAFSSWIGNVNNDAAIAGSATTSQGFLVGAVTSNTTGGANLYRFAASGTTGTLVTQSGATAQAPSSLHMYMGGRNNNGTVDRNNLDQIAMFFAGSGLTSTDVANLSTDFNGGYMTSLGTNVY